MSPRQPPTDDREIRTVYLGVFTVNALADFGSLGARNMNPTQPLPSNFSPASLASNEHEFSGLVINRHETSEESVSNRPLIDIFGRGAFTYRFKVSRLGVGFVQIETQEDFDPDFEKTVTSDTRLLIQSLADWVPTSFPELFNVDRPSTLLKPGQLLWWHRVIPATHRNRLETDFWGSSTVVELDGSTISVGDGFTAISDSLFFNRIARSQVVNGLMAATDDWLLADATNRILKKYVTEVSEAKLSKNRKKMTFVSREGEKLVEQGHHLRLFLDSRDRQLAVLKGSAWRCARTAWGLEGELSRLDSRISLIHEQTQSALARIQGDRDTWRNGTLFAIAILAAVQGLLGLIDFAVHPDIEIRHPVRGTLSGLLFVISAGIAGVIGGSWIRHRNVQASRGKRTSSQ